MCLCMQVFGISWLNGGGAFIHVEEVGDDVSSLVGKGKGRKKQGQFYNTQHQGMVGF